MNRKLLLLLTIVLLTACSAFPGGSRFDRGAMMQNLSTNIALPMINDFAAQSEALVQTAHAFRNNPSDATLTAMRDQWKVTALAWERAEVLKLDADMTLISQIDKWPSNQQFIEDFIAGDQPINVSFVSGVGSTAKGLPAVEYLLFVPDTDDATVIEQLSAPARTEYLVATAENLRDNAVALQKFWAADGDDYVGKFASAELDDGDLQSSVSMAVNEMVVVLEWLQTKELAVPLGSKSYGEPFPEAAESWRSATSNENMLANLESIKLMFTGDTAAGEGIGFEEYLDAVDAKYEDIPLSQAINNQIDEAIAAVTKINRPIFTAVTEDKANVEAAREAVHKLVVLIKNDMASQLGITITFNDSDGD